MANTMTRTATRATGGARRATRGIPTDPARDVARTAMSEAGRRVLGVVVDRAVTRVEGVADRLDGVAESGGTGLREALTGRPAPSRSDRKDGEAADRTGPVAARVGAAFSLVVYRAVQLLQLLQRLALQLLEALRRLTRRPRTAPPEPEAAGADEDGPEEDAAEDSGPGDRRDRAAERRGPRAPRSDASGPRPVRSAAAEPAEPARRGRPRPASRTAGRGRPDRADRGE